MATNTRHHPGGYDATKPAKNKAEEWDSSAGTYTAWDTSGTVTLSRALTVAEAATLAAQDTLMAADTNRQTLQQRAQAALAANAAFVSAAKPGTAAAQASAAYDQVVKATKECSVLIRLALGQTDDISGT